VHLYDNRFRNYLTPTTSLTTITWLITGGTNGSGRPQNGHRSGEWGPPVPRGRCETSRTSSLHPAEDLGTTRGPLGAVPYGNSPARIAGLVSLHRIANPRIRASSATNADFERQALFPIDIPPPIGCKCSRTCHPDRSAATKSRRAQTVGPRTGSVAVPVLANGQRRPASES
jgi:hypothetical protein